ncbi:hypothetical protein GOBAR_AA16120 [Gossypium barbadense]|uniref:Uncharacterized protein n=1 Tax=Gossypium barbadense TaxID=3634 RepID=A0A2P5XMK3_GOSBA|nr:hypothetical protein GOBAR_AA16120 [Gossypium barbadense]
MPLYPSLDDDLRLVGTSPRPLKQTMKMNITSSTPSSSTSSLPLSKLKSLTLDNIEGLDTHTLDECLQHLTSLKDLEIWNCKEVDLEGMQWEALKNISGLEILNIPTLVSLPRGLQHLTNLRLLRLTDLPNLTSLPDEMRCLTSLEYLQITEVPQLEERCRKDSGADWHKIAHIPKIRLYNEVGVFLGELRKSNSPRRIRAHQFPLYSNNEPANYKYQYTTEQCPNVEETLTVTKNITPYFVHKWWPNTNPLSMLSDSKFKKGPNIGHPHHHL